MPTPTAEAKDLIAASDLDNQELAARLTELTGRPIKHWTVSRIRQGERPPKADELEALRSLGHVSETAVPFVHARRLPPGPDHVPLYGSPTGLGALRLGEENLVGVSTIHPAQKGSTDPFDFVVPDDRLADRLMRGEVAHAVKGRKVAEGQLCLVELKNGEACPYIYVREDTSTLFVKVKQPREAEKLIPLKDIAGIYLIVSVSFTSV